MPVTCIDKDLVRRRFTRGARTYGQHAIVQKRMAETLTRKLIETLDRTLYPRVFEPGCGDGTLTRLLLERLESQGVFANDIAETFRDPIEKLAARYPHSEVSFVPGDVECIPLPPQLDLIAANAVFQWLNDLDTFYGRLRTQLTPEGVIAFSTFGENNLLELSAITGQSLGYLPFSTHCRMLERHFEIVRAWEDQETLDMPSALSILRHLKATGVNAITPQHWTKHDLAQFEHRYESQYACEAGVTLTYHPIYFILQNRTDHHAS